MDVDAKCFNESCLDARSRLSCVICPYKYDWLLCAFYVLCISHYSNYKKKMDLKEVWIRRFKPGTTGQAHGWTSHLGYWTSGVLTLYWVCLWFVLWTWGKLSVWFINRFTVNLWTWGKVSVWLTNRFTLNLWTWKKYYYGSSIGLLCIFEHEDKYQYGKSIGFLGILNMRKSIIMVHQ